MDMMGVASEEKRRGRQSRNPVSTNEAEEELTLRIEQNTVLNEQGSDDLLDLPRLSNSSEIGDLDGVVNWDPRMTGVDDLGENLVVESVEVARSALKRERTSSLSSAFL